MPASAEDEDEVARYERHIEALVERIAAWSYTDGHHGLDSWRSRGACVDQPTALWFPDLGGNGGRGSNWRGWNPARRICGRCPVRTECAEFAAVNLIPFGMFGGLTPIQRGVS